MTEPELRRPEQLSIAELRSGQRRRPLLPYDQLDIAPWPARERLRSRAEDILDKGWSIAGTKVTKLEPPLRWTGYPRSITFHLNAWEPLSRLLAAYTVTGERRYFDVVYAVALDWLKTFQAPALATTRSIEDLDGLIGRPEDFVWYDMGCGQRCYRIAFILDEILRRDEVPDEEVALFADALYFHHAALSRAHFFRSRNNHGLFQALGQWAGARRFADAPGMNAYAELGQTRMEMLFGQHFFESGVHKEHSPGYHFLMLQTFLGAESSGLLVGEAWRERLRRMENALVWMIMPDHTQAMIGDSDPRSMLDETASARYEDPQLIYMTSGGRIGARPPTGVKAYKDAGYVFARMPPRADSELSEASYLALMAGFHSVTHKHADHLSFVWYDRGQLVLADPGRYAYSGKSERGSALSKAGFMYDDPKRIFVESTRAHNTVQIDGADHARTGVAPWGSALVSADQQDGVMVAECEMRHLRSVRHRRIVVLEPAQFLLVVDWLDDRAGEKHDYVQRFVFAPHWSVETANGRATASAGGQTLKVLSLAQGFRLSAVRGQEEPELLGWISDRPNRLTPASTIAFAAAPAATTCFATLFAYGERIEADPAAQVISPTLTSARLAWRADDAERSVMLTRGVGRPIEVSCRRTASTSALHAS